MRGKYFRYVFKNLESGLLHTGSIYDKEKQITTDFVYINGYGCRSTPGDKTDGIYKKEENIPEMIDILVIGSYSAECMELLICILKRHQIKTVILPYLAPIQRLVLIEEMKEDGFVRTVISDFLQDPYQFLKTCNIRNVYFLYGNGGEIHRRREETGYPICFKAADKESIQIIRNIEGYTIPVVRAGYMIENDFLFYFGVYGPDLKDLSEFMRDYFSHIENISEMSKNANEDYISQTKRLGLEFRRKFGNVWRTTIVMFEGPLHVSSIENDSFMTEKEFRREQECELWERCQNDRKCACIISCTYKKDHDIMQHHKRSIAEARFGILLLGNVNLNRFLSQILSRFFVVLPRIRGITVPNCGNGEEWNHQILKYLHAKDRVYWICAKHDMTSAGVVSDIVLSAQNNRFLSVDENYGCCLSGYIIPKEDMN